MLEPNLATAILLSVSVLLLVVIPILDGSIRFSKYISLRYTLVALALIMSLGCILDFSHLSDESRNIVLMGGLILVGLFVLVRSLEKLKLGNKVIEVSAEKNGMRFKTKVQNKDAHENDENHHLGPHPIFENNCHNSNNEESEDIELDDSNERSND